MNLNQATDEQLDQYREQIAKILSIDPLMLDFIWMDDSETGLKNRVLYAKRGAAEVLRQKLGISVTSLVSQENDGRIMFTAIGVDKTGRQEIAVGSAYLESHKGDKKAHAVMTAQTRAVRRLTLQFVGGGILDETEVQAQTALSGTSAASQAALAGSPTVLPPPQAPISQVPGKDITPVVSTVINHEENTIAHERPIETQSQFEIRQAALRADAQKQLADKKPVNSGPFITETPLNQGIALENAADFKPDTEPKKRGRPRKQRNTVVLESPGQQIEMPTGYIDATGQITSISVPPATANEPEQGTIGNGQTDIPALAETPVPLQANAVVPTQVNSAVVSVLPKEKQDEYRTRLSKYYNDVLPRGGMQSSEGIGGPTMKVRKFAAIHTGVADTKLMTEQHWSDLFEFLDANADNPKFLVEYINKALGVA